MALIVVEVPQYIIKQSIEDMSLGVKMSKLSHFTRGRNYNFSNF